MVAQDSPEGQIGLLTALLDVEALDRDLYRGARMPGAQGRVFGGQVVAQGLVAAGRSVEDGRAAHSLHAYFMRPGDDALPIIYRVVRDYDGRSFATRRVIALQKGVPILNMAASFQTPEQGLSHQADMPDVPAPEMLLSEADHARANADAMPEAAVQWITRPRPIELRPVDPRWANLSEKRAPAQHVWFRAAAALGDDPALHRAVLAYASDMGLLGTSTLAHGISWLTNKLQMASLDHAVWLHEDVRADDWLLYSMDSPWTGHARGFNRGSVFTRDGRLVASMAQEGLIRLRD